MTDDATLDALKAAALSDPADAVSCYAVADVLEEEGDDVLAFAWRWMGRHGRRPSERETFPADARWAWHGELKDDWLTPEESALADSLPSLLPWAVWRLICPHPGLQGCFSYRDADAAVLGLADVLWSMKESLEGKGCPTA